MFLPSKFTLERQVVSELLDAGGFVHLITPTDTGLEVTSLPMLYDANAHSLVGHVARANPHWRRTDTTESVAVLPVSDAYISPSFYPSKAQEHKVVPTWNYETLYAYGQLVAHDDVAWLGRHVDALTDNHEMGRPDPWQVRDAPAEFIGAQLRAIVGIELRLDRVVGKSKMSQNKSDLDRDGVVAGLADGTEREQDIAARIRARN